MDEASAKLNPRPMFNRKSMAAAALALFILSPGPMGAQTSVSGGFYRIISGSYSECCGLSGKDTIYTLPNQSQSFVRLQIDPQNNTATMSLVGEDHQTVFTTVPCPADGALDFSFPYGFAIANSVVFHVDPGPPPYGKYWNYTASN